MPAERLADIYYYARSADGSHSKKSSAKSVSIGQTFTCTYASFGLSAQDLEYKLGTTTEDKVAYLKTTMDLVSGGLNTGLQVWSAMKNSKDIKRKEQMHGDGYFMFNGKELTNICYEKEFNYGPSGYGKKAEIKQLVDDMVCDESTMTTDSNGAWYCVNKVSSKPCSADTNSDYEKTTDGSINECSAVENLQLTGPEKNKKCWVKISKATDISISEKLSELIRTKMDLDSMAQDAASAQSNIQNAKAMGQYFQVMGMGQVVSAIPSTLGFGQSTESACSSFRSYSSSVYSSNTDVEKKYMEDMGNSVSPNCRYQGGLWECVNKNEGCVRNSDGSWTGKTSVDGGLPDEGDLTKKVKKIQTSATGVLSLGATVAKGSEEDRTTLKNYNAVKNAYTSNQNSLNTKKKELQELKDAQSGSISSIASTSTQTLMNTANTLITTKMNSDSKRGTMTGNCYLGDPANGNLFLTEGATKKIDWKLFN